MRILIVACALLVSCYAGAQDSLKKSLVEASKIRHEVGANVTTLLKQVLSFSNTNFPTLPYDITYKTIFPNGALRAGFGVSLNNSENASTTTTTTNSSTSQPSQPGPDPVVPTINKSSSLSFRVGYECRHAFEKNLIGSLGIDFIGNKQNSFSQSSGGFNNLPHNYNFNKTTDDISVSSFGFGPVGGLQVFISKRLSLFTEMPLYILYATEKETTTSYSNSAFSSGSGGPLNFTATNVVRQSTLETTTVTLTLPVTLYLAVTF